MISGIRYQCAAPSPLRFKGKKEEEDTVQPPDVVDPDAKALKFADLIANKLVMSTGLLGDAYLIHYPSDSDNDE